MGFPSRVLLLAFFHLIGTLGSFSCVYSVASFSGIQFPPHGLKKVAPSVLAALLGIPIMAFRILPVVTYRTVPCYT